MGYSLANEVELLSKRSLGVCLIHRLAITVLSITNIPHMGTEIVRSLPLNQKQHDVQKDFFPNENLMICTYELYMYIYNFELTLNYVINSQIAPRSSALIETLKSP